MRASKGSAFERELSKALSIWWSKGLGLEPQDDIFWRSSQSGGRATQRAKSGKKTFGSYGDIAAVNPIGQPLIKAFTIELKRGSSHGCPGDLLDFKEDNKSHAWVKCLTQAIRSHRQAGSRSWLLICKRDHRIPVVFLPTPVLAFLMEKTDFKSSLIRFHITAGKERVYFAGLSLQSFLERVGPKQIIQYLKMEL